MRMVSVLARVVEEVVNVPQPKLFLVVLKDLIMTPRTVCVKTRVAVEMVMDKRVIVIQTVQMTENARTEDV